MLLVDVILGLLLSLRFQLNNFSYHLHGDNSVSLLTRAKADRINCTVARQANLVFTTVSMHLNATVAGTQEIIMLFLMAWQEVLHHLL